ncbi:alkaline phosphatase [Rhodonellum psychrophilum GCM71 = DSM 17998]|uniref:Alkaline phosphatase n=2 Tax=Rhodonellum TaxID=336827 RepID=U5C708_9BACT|nr:MULTISPECIES: alkaline phosphatase PafA [Rhodonellum]ERM84741.1 alkaline phosphatase [Rhodonellum psychrophilum GCM71 = DSM 17998]SDZ12352.1 Type I phosphodiesterase / nucleotide pyrophosphatase [Rhodonellum ikkaensis]
MKSTLLTIFLGLILTSATFGQKTEKPAGKPKLVVGIVVDQMRQEYFYKYQDRYTEGGFKRLMNEGFMMKNGHYNYIPTYTGPGHASVYTGATPSTHGIIGNNWYVPSLGRSIYCAEDSTVTAVGGSAENGKISPRNMLSTTISDEMRFASNKRSKVVGIAIKDRGAALPAGHMGDAYWFDSKTGNFMTSNYYYDTLPKWVSAFNEKELAKKYLSQKWEPLFPIATYTQSIADDNEFEGPFIGMTSPSFPYDLPALMQDNGEFGLISTTPYGNSLTLDMAYAALEGEQLGKRGEMDLLAVSFSSPDYIGHRFGPSSVEVEDTYLKLDREMEKFLNYLDKEYGKGEYLVFLTADHAVADIVDYMKSENIPAGNFNSRFILTQLRGFSQAQFGEGNWILNFSNEQVFLNKALAKEKGLDDEKMQRQIAEFLLGFEGIKEVYTATDLRRNEYLFGRKNLLQMGYNHKASGDLLLILEPAWLSNSYKGTTHGTGYTYDTHVPIVFFGWNIQPGSSSRYATVTDIAPTLSVLLETRLPNGATGHPILEITDKK